MPKALRRMMNKEEIRGEMQNELLAGVANIIFKDRHLALESKCNVPLADEILSYLKSNGVVRKVDKELPPMPRSWYGYGDVDGTYKAGRKSLLKAGYVAVEELI